MVVDSLGPEHFERHLAMLKRGGTFIALTVGIPEAVKKHGPLLGLVVAFANVAYFLVKARITKGVRFYPIARKPDGNVLAQIAKLVDDGEVRPIIDKVLPMSEVREAHRISEEGRSRGKVVLEMATSAPSQST